MFLTKPPPNPKLEQIREEGLKGTRENHTLIKDTVERLKPKTSRVHASWLFYGDDKAERTLQKIMRLIDGYKSSTLYPGWKDFANALGVPRDVINPIDNQSFGKEGYTYYVLLHFAQLKNASLFKVLSALLELSRYDVLTETNKLFEDVADGAISYQGIYAMNDPNNTLERNDGISSLPNEEDSGYFPSSINGEMGNDLTGSQNLGSDAGTLSSGFRESRHEYEEMSEVEGNLIKPPTVRKVPLMLQHIKENQNQNVIVTPFQTLPSIQVQENHLQMAAPDRIPPSSERIPPSSDIVKVKNSQKKKSYICVVMLTFANDGICHANEVARILRKRRENGQKIGVLMLNEHLDTVEINPYQFINNTFPQVHYVIPIITEGYIRAATSSSAPPANEATYLDCKYVRFIYDLMLKNYADNGCLNKKVRCLIPDAFVHLIYRTLMRQPLFGAWERLSNTDSYAERWVKKFSRSKNED